MNTLELKLDPLTNDSSVDTSNFNRNNEQTVVNLDEITKKSLLGSEISIKSFSQTPRLTEVSPIAIVPTVDMKKNEQIFITIKQTNDIK